MRAKGQLLIIGGAEDIAGQEGPDMEISNIKFKRYEILKTLLAASNESICIITSASGSHAKMRKTYLYAFSKITSVKPKFIHIREKKDARSPKILELIEKTNAVFFTGGDQSRLTSLLRNTDLINIIRTRYLNEPNFLVAGTSAGAMALSDIMIKGGNPQEALLAGKLKMGHGLNILQEYIIDTHFIKRGRIGRLTHAILLKPKHIGIGLGEDTALIIRNGIAECRGSGMVVIINGKYINRTNIDFARKGEPVYVTDLNMHLLVKGNQFSFLKNKLIN